MNPHDINAGNSANAETYAQIKKITAAQSFQERLAPIARKSLFTRYVFQALDGLIVAIGAFVLLIATIGNPVASAIFAVLIAASLEVFVGAFLPLAIRHIVQGWLKSGRYWASFALVGLAAVVGVGGCFYFSVKATPEIVAYLRGNMQPPALTSDSTATAFYDSQIAYKQAELARIAHLADGTDWVVTNKTYPAMTQELTALVAKRDSVQADNRSRNERTMQNHEEGSAVISSSVRYLGGFFLAGIIILIVFWEYYAIQSEKEKPEWLERLFGTDPQQPPVIPHQPPIIPETEETETEKRIPTEPDKVLVPHKEQPETETETETIKQNKHEIADLKKHLRVYYKRSVTSASEKTRNENRVKALAFAEQLEARGIAVTLLPDGAVDFK